MFSKNVNNKKCSPKLVFFNEKKIVKDSDDFWMSNFGTFWRVWSSLKNQVAQTWFLVYFYLDFYCICSLQKSNSKLTKSQVCPTWFFKFDFSIWVFKKSSADQQCKCIINTNGFEWEQLPYCEWTIKVSNWSFASLYWSFVHLLRFNLWFPHVAFMRNDSDDQHSTASAGIYRTPLIRNTNQ